MKIGIRGVGISVWRKSGTSAPPAAPTVSGTISNQSVQQGTGVVTYSTAGAFTGSSLTYSLTGGGAGITINPATGVVSVDRAVVAVNVFSLTVFAANVSGSVNTGFTLTVTAASAVSYGFDANLDLGTDGDYFVDAVSGSNANPGTSFGAAKQTIAAAMALATAGQKVRVIGHGVNYRETITAKTGVAVLGYGTHKPVLNAGEVLTGWTQCTGADAAVLGSVTPANIWKRTGLAKTDIASSDPFGMNLIENGEKLPMARTWGRVSDRPLFLDNPLDYIQAESTVTEVVAGPITQIRGWVLPTSYASLTSAQVLQTVVRYIAEPNANRADRPASYNAATRTITSTATDETYENNDYKDSIALFNLIPAMTQGQWGFVDNGSTVDVYCWPKNTANLSASMEYARRSVVIDLTNAYNFEFAGFVVANASSTSTNPADGGHAISSTSTTARSGGILRNLKVKNTERFRNGYGVFDIKTIGDLSITGCTVDTAIGQFGMFLRGQTGDTTAGSVGLGWSPMVGANVSNNLIRFTESGPFRIYSSRDLAITRNVMEFCGMSTHSNKISVYEQCHNVLIAFNRFRGANGYITWQESSDIVIIANDMIVSYNAADSGNIGRGVEDQNGNNVLKPGPARFDVAYRPTVNGSLAHNNRVAPYDLFGATENRSFNIGSTETTVFWSAYNNLINGSNNTIPSQITAFDRNFYTNGSGVPGFDANSQFSTAASTYVDHTVANLTIAPGSAVRSMAGQNLSATIAALGTRFPQVTDWTTDIAGNSINWATPPIGPCASYDDYGTFAPSRIRWPAITGAEFVGETLYFDTGWVEADPWPGQVSQLQLSTDLITWGDKPGANGPTYVVQAGDAGSYPRIRVTTGADVAYSQPGGLIGSSYPLADPVVLLSHGDTTSGAQYESPTFTATNKPLMVFVFHNLVTGSSTPQTVTIGASGRAFGTGTSIPQATLGLRGSNQMTAHYIASPGSGTVTIQDESSAASNGTRIVVVEVDGAGGVGVSAHIGASTATRTPSILTSADDSIVFYAGYKSSSTPDVLSVTGATEIDSGNTGGTSSTDVICLIAWELAPSITTYDCTITGAFSGTFGASAIEVTS